MLKLGVNIDHVATLRQARYATMLDSPNAEPVLLEAALMAEGAGADSITVHLRADRRHLQDRDLYALREGIATKLNLEMGNSAEILAIGLEVKPDFVCLVPENREEITTEGGLDVVGNFAALRPTVAALKANGALVSLFIDAEPEQVAAAKEVGGAMVELHTGGFANAEPGAGREAIVDGLEAAAVQANRLGLQVNAGHGINMGNLEALFRIPHLAELNIGHHLVARAVTVGLAAAVREMVEAMRGYRGGGVA